MNPYEEPEAQSLEHAKRMRKDVRPAINFVQVTAMETVYHNPDKLEPSQWGAQDNWRRCTKWEVETRLPSDAQFESNGWIPSAQCGQPGDKRFTYRTKMPLPDMTIPDPPVGEISQETARKLVEALRGFVLAEESFSRDALITDMMNDPLTEAYDNAVATLTIAKAEMEGV